MNKELIISASPTNVEIAMLDNERLVEIHQQRTKANFSVGDIFVGRVRKLMPGLNAAFVDIGHRQDAFLHYTDLGPKLRSLLKYTDKSIRGEQHAMLEEFVFDPEIVKTGKIDQVLERNQPVLVQILKEPISTKGPRLSCEITIPGRYVVLVPFSNIISISKKISTSEERKRLQVLVTSIRPKNFGVIVRTASEGKKVADLHDEIRSLTRKWEEMHRQLRHNKKSQKLLSELDKASSILRDVLNDSFDRIVVNDRVMYENVRDFLSNIAPDQVGIVQLHKSRKPIFDTYGISRQIKASFGKTSTLPSGAYIVIESTEAMHVIDVNSGPKTQKRDQEASAISVNLEAAEEIARQLRLRDIGGLIIIDFIDMRSQENKIKLLQEMRQFMKRDRAQHTILPLSKFGLMQITRQRVKPEIVINTEEQCPSCEGSGKVTPTILISDAIQRDLKFILNSRPKSRMRLETHPYIYAWLKHGLPNQQQRWWWKYNTWIRLQANTDFGLNVYKFFDQNNDEIRM